MNNVVIEKEYKNHILLVHGIFIPEDLKLTFHKKGNTIINDVKCCMYDMFYEDHLINYSYYIIYPISVNYYMINEFIFKRIELELL